MKKQQKNVCILHSIKRLSA